MQQRDCPLRFASRFTSFSLRKLKWDAFDAFNEIEMGVAGNNRQPMLAGDGGNPQVVHRYRGSVCFQGETEVCVVERRDVINAENPGTGERTLHP